MHNRTWRIMRRCRCRERAFTLIELVVVVAILAIATAVVAINLVNVTPTARLRSDARTIGSRIEMLMDEAVSRGRTIYIYYDLSSDPQKYYTYVPARYDKDGVRHDAVALSPRLISPGIKIKYVRLPDSGTVSSGVYSVEFNPLRTEGTHIVCLEASNEKIISIKANVFSGVVSYFESEIRFREYTD